MKFWIKLFCLFTLSVAAILLVTQYESVTEAVVVDTPSQDDLNLEAKPIMTIEGWPPQHPNSQNHPTIPQNRQGIADELQGKFPIHMPEYKGVEQLLLLSNRWVVVVTSNLEEVSQELQKLAANDQTFPDFKHISFLEAQEMWKKSKEAKNFNWYLLRRYLEPIMYKYLAQARENAGERLLDTTTYYQISSADDAAYATTQNPTRVTRFIVSRGGEWIPGFNPDYAQYSYLELPTPMVNGQNYTIRLKNGKSVTFLYDEKRTVARSIKVNQVGYLPDIAHKYAYLGGYLFEFGPMDFSEFEGKDFYAIDVNSGDRVLTGKISLREKNPRFGTNANQEPMSGEDVYQLDLSELRRPGIYFLSIPGIGRSWPFKVSDDVYGEAFYNAMRGMFAQRCGIALTKEFSAWTRQSCHHEPTYESEFARVEIRMNPPKVNPFDVIGATIDYSKSTPGPVYGWHDAADWDKNTAHYAPLFSMLTLYEMAPHKFHDGQLNLPNLPEQGIGGSGDGIPDLLNEAEFGLKVWQKSLTPEGGVSGIWETWTHPPIDDPKVHYAYGVRMQWSSLLYATAAAQFAHLVRPFDPNKAAAYEAEAIKAYEYGSNPKNFQSTFTMHGKTNRGSGEPFTVVWEDKKAYHIPYLASAKLRLYILTGDEKYLDGLDTLLAEAVDTVNDPGGYWDFFPFLYYGMFTSDLNGKVSEAIRRKLKIIYAKRADALVNHSAKDPYRRAIDRNNKAMAWGWGVTTNRAKWLLLANHLIPNEAYREAAGYNADYQLGTNPQGMMWTSGMGFVYPIHFQHGISEDDQIIDPFPGIQLYGPTPSGWRMISRIWIPQDANKKNITDAQGKTICFLPPGNCEGDYIRLPPALRRYATHPGLLVDQNEFTVQETMGGALFTYGLLMNDNWMPSEALKNRKPRADHLLFGYWYLP